MSNLVPQSHLNEVAVVRDLKLAFQRTVDQLQHLSDRGVEAPSLNIDDPRTMAAIKGFLAWTRTYSKAEWDAGVPLSFKERQEVTGRGSTGIDGARRACLIRVAGNRKSGEKDRYHLNKDALLGLLKLLASSVAREQASMLSQYAIAEKNLELQANLDATMNVAMYEQETQVVHVKYDGGDK